MIDTNKILNDPNFDFDSLDLKELSEKYGEVMDKFINEVVENMNEKCGHKFNEYFKNRLLGDCSLAALYYFEKGRDEFGDEDRGLNEVIEEIENEGYKLTEADKNFLDELFEEDVKQEEPRA